MKTNKPTWGGTRQGSGAKPKYGEKTLTFGVRCPESKIPELKAIIRSKLDGWVLKPKCVQADVSVSFSTECNQNFRTPTYSFKDGKYYRDEKYFGDVIYSDEKMIQVECKNGNKYMEGQIITIWKINIGV